MAPSPRAQIVDWATSIYEDLEFTVARQWLDDHPGRKATGFLPVYAPKEIIHAAGMLPVGIHGNGAIEIIRGDAYYQSYICHLPRSVVELAESGRLDFLSAAEDAGADYASLCAHSSMDMFVSRGLGQELCSPHNAGPLSSGRGPSWRR